MSADFNDVIQFWSFVRQSKERAIRTILFDASSNVIRVVETFSRGKTCSEDVANLCEYLSESIEPVWFLVRCDFSDSTDSHFKLGFSGLPSAATNRFVALLGSTAVGYLPCGYYGTKQGLEDRIWDHLFPLVEDPATGNSVVGAVVEDGSRFKLVASTSISDFCRKRISAYVLCPTDHIIRIYFFNPDGVCPRCRVKDSSVSRSRTVLAFMKPDLIPWLMSCMYDSFEFEFGSDIHSCADLPSLTPSAPVVSRESLTGRRRTNQIVLSPPTLEKYTGPSKRTRNFSARIT
jgi:hypothetical protein